MALRSKIDWSKLASQLHPSELPKWNKFKGQFDATHRQATVLPSELPKIDWAFYKKHAVDPKIVAELEKNYTTLKVKEPKASPSRLDEVKRCKEQDLQRLNKYKEYAKSYIESCDVVQGKFKKMIPVNKMWPEDWVLTFPEWSQTPDSPSLSPHYGRRPGLTRAEAGAFEQPDPLPFSTKQAWKDWEKRKNQYVD